MRRLLIMLMVGTLLFVSIPLAMAAKENFPPEFQEGIRKGHQKLEAGQYQDAALVFHNVINKLPDRYYYNVPPALILNMAMALDKAPGHLFSAGAWYKTYAVMFPDDPRAAKLRQLSEAQLAQFDQYVLAAAPVLEAVYEEMEVALKGQELWAANPLADKAMDDAPAFRKRNANNRKLLRDAIGNVEAARIFVGDVDTGLKNLRRYGVVNDHPNVLYALVDADRPADARPYAQGESDGTLLVEAGLLTPDEAAEYDRTDKDLIQIMQEHGALSPAEAAKFPRGQVKLQQQLLQLHAEESGQSVEEIEKAMTPEERVLWNQFGNNVVSADKTYRTIRSNYAKLCREGDSKKAYLNVTMTSAKKSYELGSDNPAFLRGLKLSYDVIVVESFANYAEQLQLLALRRRIFRMLEDECKASL